MPTPRRNESQKDFVGRCIPIVKHEDRSRSNEQVNAICFSIFRDFKRKQRRRAEYNDDILWAIYECGVAALDVFDSVGDFHEYETQKRRPPTTTQTLIMA